jgi:hypothetical protein
VHGQGVQWNVQGSRIGAGDNVGVVDLTRDLKKNGGASICTSGLVNHWRWPSFASRFM